MINDHPLLRGASKKKLRQVVVHLATENSKLEDLVKQLMARNLELHIRMDPHAN